MNKIFVIIEAVKWCPPGYLLPLRHEFQELYERRSVHQQETIWSIRAKRKRKTLAGKINKNKQTNMRRHTLNLSGRERSSFTLMDRPMSVAMLQWGMVGVNSMPTVLSASLTWTQCRKEHSICDNSLISRANVDVKSGDRTLMFLW